jgi:hypothetical protein
VIGPGLGKTPEAEGAAGATRPPRQADGRRCRRPEPARAQKRWPTYFKAHTVLTPHPGEMKRLGKLIGDGDQSPTDDDGRIEWRPPPRAHSARSSCSRAIAPSSPTARVSTSTAPATARFPRPAPATSSAASIGSLLGQRMDRFDAACAGVHLHGRAGELAGQTLGRRCALAREVIEALPQAIREYEQQVGVAPTVVS